MRRFFVLGVHFIILGSFFFLSPPAIQSAGNNTKQNTREDLYSSPWVDSVFHSLSLEERIAQLLMIRVHTDRDEAYYDSIVHLVRDYNIGGAAFFRGEPTQQVLVTNRMQSQVQTPMLIAMDAEWGPAMRLDSLEAFPRQMALGAVRNSDMIYEMGKEIGRQLRRMGVHINFAPVVDVNNNSENPVINFRAFGEDRQLVAEKGLAYMHGLQDEGIIACAKHFPGHGDTNLDSHHTLPLLKHTFEEVDSIHLYPFKRLIEQGLQSVMIAHLEMPSLEPEPKLASTLSHNIVTKLLQMEMGFNGLIITDALDMRGVSDYFEPGELELRALMAGNDILLLPENVPAAINTIKNAILNGILPEEYLNLKCRKVLHFKEKAGLDNFRYATPEMLVEDLNTIQNRLLNKKLVESSLTLVRNQQELVPLRNIAHKRIAALSIGATPDNAFHERLNKYSPVSRYGIDKYHTPVRAFQMMKKLEAYDLVIISVHDNSFFFRNDYGINGKTIGLIHSIARKQDVILSLFANPYSLAFFEDEILYVDAILVAYQEGELFEHAAAEALFNGIQLTGKLPVTAGKHIPANTGIVTAEPTRIRFGYPEEAGIRGHLLHRIDSLAERGILEKAYPGCQVAIIKDGVMIYNKAFGYHTYDSITPVNTSDIYDLASVTKVAATTVALMKLHEQGRIDLDAGIAKYLPWIGNPDIGEITMRDILAHQAGFKPWIPFFTETLNQDGSFVDGLYHTYATDEFPVKVSPDMYLHRDFRESMFARISNSELSESRDYRYSDLGFILLAEIINHVTGQPLDSFVHESFYMPLGLQNTGFRPGKHSDSIRITPTERDTLWRRQTVHGYVHDPAAAMLGGVSGHAGLFANAADMAVLMQMIINGGSYGGDQYFESSAVEKFTTAHFTSKGNRRGLGFDKPALDRDQSGPSAKSASPLSFGHSGFTGTYVWADPMEDLVFVFLSNRTYPSQSNRKLIEMNIRTDMMQEIYNAIIYSRILENVSFIPNETIDK